MIEKPCFKMCPLQKQASKKGVCLENSSILGSMHLATTHPICLSMRMGTQQCSQETLRKNASSKVVAVAVAVIIAVAEFCRC